MPRARAHARVPESSSRPLAKKVRRGVVKRWARRKPMWGCVSWVRGFHGRGWCPSEDWSFAWTETHARCSHHWCADERRAGRGGDCHLSDEPYQVVLESGGTVIQLQRPPSTHPGYGHEQECGCGCCQLSPLLPLLHLHSHWKECEGAVARRAVWRWVWSLFARGEWGGWNERWKRSRSSSQN